MSKLLVLMLLALLVLSSLVMVATVFAQSTSTPSVPEFTVELVDSSYDVPTTYSIDHYTGKNVTTEGYHVESRTIEIRIKNEMPYGYIAGFFYNIRWKGHFEEEWREFYHSSAGLSRSSGAETVFSREGEFSSTEGLKMDTQGMDATFPPDSQIDFQVEARIGSIEHRIASMYSYDVFVGETSGWSETQTVTIPEIPSASPSLEPAPSVEPALILSLVALVLSIVAVVAVFAVLLLYFKKHVRKETQS